MKASICYCPDELAIFRKAIDCPIHGLTICKLLKTSMMCEKCYEIKNRQKNKRKATKV